MKTLNIILVTFLLTSCALPVRKHIVQLDVLSVPKEFKDLAGVSRSEKYKKCVIDFSREGIKQIFIKDLCDSTYGSLE